MAINKMGCSIKFMLAVLGTIIFIGILKQIGLFTKHNTVSEENGTFGLPSLVSFQGNKDSVEENSNMVKSMSMSNTENSKGKGETMILNSTPLSANEATVSVNKDKVQEVVLSKSRKRKPREIKPWGGTQDFRELNMSLPFTLITVETDTDNLGYNLLARSCAFFGVPLVTLGEFGEGEKWKGGDGNKGAGHGHKLKFVQTWLQQQDPDRIVVFTDGHDTLLRISGEEFGARLQELLPDNKTVYFSSSKSWHPGQTPFLDQFPPVPDDTTFKYLNSGNFAGKASALLATLDSWVFEEQKEKSDQLFFTHLWLKQNVTGVTIKLDYDCYLFMPLGQVRDEIKLGVTDDRTYITMKRTNDKPAPAILHGPGPNKHLFIQLSNYEAGSYNVRNGTTWHARYEVPEEIYEQPKMVLAVLCKDADPLSIEKFALALRLTEMDYKKTLLWIWYGKDCLMTERKEWESLFLRYEKFEQFSEEECENDCLSNVKLEALKYAKRYKAEYVFMIDTLFWIKRFNIIKQLIEDDLPLVVPLGKKLAPSMYANFWVSARHGWYRREMNYEMLLYREHRGLFAVAFGMNALMIRYDIYDEMIEDYTICGMMDLDSDVCINSLVRERMKIPIVLDNREIFGELLDYGSEVNSTEVM